MSLSYLPAVLKNNKHGWQIEYQALDPVSGKLKRHVTKLNALRKRYSRLADFKAHCNTIICTTNAKLAGGLIYSHRDVFQISRMGTGNAEACHQQD